MPSSWVNVSPGKMTVRKLKRLSFSRAEIVITAQKQIATTSVSENTTFFIFSSVLDSILVSLGLGPILCVGDPSSVGFSLYSTIDKRRTSFEPSPEQLCSAPDSR